MDDHQFTLQPHSLEPQVSNKECQELPKYTEEATDNERPNQCTQVPLKSRAGNYTAK